MTCSTHTLGNKPLTPSFLKVSWHLICYRWLGHISQHPITRRQYANGYLRNLLLDLTNDHYGED